MKPFNFLKLSAAACVLMAGTTNAQVVGTDAFLRGHYLEVGLGAVGNFGSDVSAPTGYHAHLFSGIGVGPLGFVTDPGMDGWLTGTPSMMGDYFLPAYPYEGWTLQVGSKVCNAGQHGGGTSHFTLTGSMGPCTGSNISCTSSGPYVSSTWQGMVDSIQVTQVTTLDTNSLYFIVRVTLTNMSFFPKNNLFYSRDLDPDNESTWGGGSTTRNVIEHQMPDVFGASVISARGTTYPSMSYMALGSTDTASRVLAFPGLYMTTTPALAYTGGSAVLFAAGDSNLSDVGIGIVMSIPHLATVDSAGDSVYRTTASAGLHPANSTTFSYFYAFSPDAVDSAIAHSGLPVSSSTLAIKNVNSQADVRVYPNPSKDMVNITNLAATDHLSLIDMMGRNIAQGWAVANNGTNTFHYSNVPTGAYIILVTDASGNVKARVPVRKS